MHQSVDTIMVNRHFVFIKPSGADGIPLRGSSIRADHDLGGEQQHSKRIVSRFVIPSDDDEVSALHTIGIAILAEEQAPTQTVPHPWNLGRKMREASSQQHAPGAIDRA